MSININRATAQKNPVVEQNTTQKQQSVNQQTQTTGSSSKDSVQLTSQALNLNKMQEKTAQPQVNAKRIASLKSAIINGDYKINAERLAEKLSKFEGDFSKAFG